PSNKEFKCPWTRVWQFIRKGQRTWQQPIHCYIAPHWIAVLAWQLCKLSTMATPDTAWVARYNFDPPTGINHVLAMTLDPAGNIVIGGTASTTNGDNDYFVVKYSPAGTQHWAVTYNSGPLADDQLRRMKVDVGGNIYLTGTSKTVKY